MNFIHTYSNVRNKKNHKIARVYSDKISKKFSPHCTFAAAAQKRGEGTKSKLSLKVNFVM